jgi:hypothetical protein
MSLHIFLNLQADFLAYLLENAALTSTFCSPSLFSSADVANSLTIVDVLHNFYFYLLLYPIINICLLLVLVILYFEYN